MTTLTIALMLAAAACGAVAGACLASWFEADFRAYLVEQVEAWRREAEGE